MKVDENYLSQLCKKEGQQECSWECLKEIYKKMGKPKARAVFLDGKYFISFKTAPKVQFKVTTQISDDSLEFFDSIISANAGGKEQGVFNFLWEEFAQGRGKEKFFRFVFTILPLVLFDCFLVFLASKGAVNNTFTGFLTAVSIFIAIFSLFTVSHEHIERKKLRLFETGKLGYMFSVDKNITTLGVFTIVLSLLGTLLAEEGIVRFWITEDDLRKWLIVIFLNLCFICTYIILRSIIEFYIHRPAVFIMGDLKKEYLEKFDD